MARGLGGSAILGLEWEGCTLGIAEMMCPCQIQAGTASPETGGPVEQGLVPLCSEQGAMGTEPTWHSWKSLF